MARITSFEDLEVWQLARALTSKIYRMTRAGEFSKDFGLKDQIRRAAVSIVSNIAEGFDRKSSNQFVHFLEIASGSTSEVKAQLYVALDAGYVSQKQFSELFADAKRIGQMLTKLMQYLRTASNRQAASKATQQAEESCSKRQKE